MDKILKYFTFYFTKTWGRLVDATAHHASESGTTSIRIWSFRVDEWCFWQVGNISDEILINYINPVTKNGRIKKKLSELCGSVNVFRTGYQRLDQSRFWGYYLFETNKASIYLLSYNPLEVYLGPSQTSKVELFPKIVN